MSLYESACHEDASSPCPLFSMTALLRRRHPRGAEDRQGQQPKRAIPERVEPATKEKKYATSLREVMSSQTRQQSDQINGETCAGPATFLYLQATCAALKHLVKNFNSKIIQLAKSKGTVNVQVPKVENHQLLEEAGFSESWANALDSALYENIVKRHKTPL